MVVPLEVNGTRLSFILDSGVGKPILFNLADQDSIELRNVRKLTIQGIGTGEPIEALSSVGNTFRLASLVNHGQQVFVVLDKDLNFSTSLGIPVHGIIGYDLFRDFVVEINYGRQFLRFHDPKTYKPRPGKGAQTLPLDVDHNKAFLEGSVVVRDGAEVPVRLLMDTGALCSPRPRPPFPTWNLFRASARWTSATAALGANCSSGSIWWSTTPRAK